MVARTFQGIPSVAAIGQRYGVTLAQYEALKWTLFDSAPYPATGVTQLPFFQLPKGQGTGFGGGVKTASDTNMVSQGQLPASQLFLITDLEVDFWPTKPTVAGDMPAAMTADAIDHLVNDVYIFYRSGNLTLQIASKNYLEDGPIAAFPPKSMYEITAAAVAASPGDAGALQSRIKFARVSGEPYSLEQTPIMLQSNDNFSVTLAWPEGLQAITNPAWVYVRLNGFLYRAAQ